MDVRGCFFINKARVRSSCYKRFPRAPVDGCYGPIKDNKTLKTGEMQ